MNAWCPSERVATRSAIDEISSKFIGEPRSEVHCSMQSGKLRSKPAEPLSPSTRITNFSTVGFDEVSHFSHNIGVD